MQLLAALRKAVAVRSTAGTFKEWPVESHQIAALRRPMTVAVAVLLAAVMVAEQTSRDILPSLNVSTIYVAQPYGVMDPAQMEGYLTYYRNAVTGWVFTVHCMPGARGSQDRTHDGPSKC
jgi:hypothetical protein